MTTIIKQRLKWKIIVEDFGFEHSLMMLQLSRAELMVCLVVSRVVTWLIGPGFDYSYVQAF